MLAGIRCSALLIALAALSAPAARADDALAFKKLVTTLNAQHVTVSEAVARLKSEGFSCSMAKRSANCVRKVTSGPCVNSERIAVQEGPGGPAVLRPDRKSKCR